MKVQRKGRQGEISMMIWLCGWKVEGCMERTHPVQPGTSSCEARWGPSRASAALPGLQALRAHIWDNFSLCIVTNHGIFQKKAKKKRFIGRTLAPLHYDYTTTIVPALKLALFGFSSSPPFVSPGSSLSLLFSNSKSGNPGENILHPLLKWEWAPWR